ncbi:YybH family protein [Xanthomonas graminis]|uniref:SnoaL-like domain-containing protein n=1 Tax=Xanthomonas graminis pv. graminis TaxID=134874 RepID=A0A1M4L5B9_9XANT|nr:nuclear transport factor 2 family protein [Xanthomonas translucens]SBV88367.1 hypothetical protein XTGNCPPB3709_2308 [Xanthomonas translucens pv. graminis]
MLSEHQLIKIYKEIQPHFVLTGDVDGYAGLFTDDAVWWPLGRPTRIGPQQIGKGFAEVVADTRIVAVFDAVDLIVCGNFGRVALLGTETIAYDNGDPTQIAHSREVWEFRDVDGQAKISRMLWNSSVD